MESKLIKEMSFEDYLHIKDDLQTKYDDFWNQNILKGELENPYSKYYVLKEDKDILGFGGFIDTAQDMEITNIVIRKDCRGKGYGDFLLKFLINEIKDIYNQKEDVFQRIISLEVNETNEVAINLYRKNGFEEDGRRKKYYENRYDAVIMSRKI